MNNEHYSDPTADIAVGRVMKEWRRAKRNEREKAEREHIFKDDSRTTGRSGAKRRTKERRKFQEKKTVKGNT